MRHCSGAQGQCRSLQAKLAHAQRFVCADQGRLLRRQRQSRPRPPIPDFIRQWPVNESKTRHALGALTFERGDTFQADWSDEGLAVGGIDYTLQASQMGLCASRAPWLKVRKAKGRLVNARDAAAIARPLASFQFETTKSGRLPKPSNEYTPPQLQIQKVPIRPGSILNRRRYTGKFFKIKI